MKLLVLADLHYSLKQLDWLLNECSGSDAVLIVGDLLDLATPVDKDVQSLVVLKYLDRIRERSQLVVSSGNHDGTARNAGRESVAAWLEEFRRAGGQTDGDLVRIGGDWISVCPWWDGDDSRDALTAQIEKQAASRTGRWIWVHHAPPEDSRVSWNGRRHIGDPNLSDLIRRHEPDMVFCGHIHNSPFYPDGSWYDRFGNTWLFNPGRQIGSVPTHIRVDLESDTADYVSLEHRESIDLGVSATA